MNIRKPTDYSPMFKALDQLMTASLPQMELNCEIGRLVSDRPEKGAAVAAAEYLSSSYPDTVGFTPGICAGCGIFTGPMRTPRKYWPRQ